MWKKKLLIVEDEAALVFALSEKFRHEGLSVMSAQDGELGFKIALRRRPDLILLDINLPKMDGLTMLSKLRKQNDWGKTLPVIILTNLPDDDEGRHKIIEETKPVEYLTKYDWKLSDVVLKVRERLAV